MSKKETMKLSRFERLSLINQFKIIQLLDPKNSKDYESNLEILRNGYEGLYEDVLSEVQSSLSEEATSFVYDTLHMFQSIHYYCIDNSADPNTTKYHSKFDGFDGNNETQYYGIANWLIQNEKMYPDLSKCMMNSHSERLDIYQAMVKEWKLCPNKNVLTSSDLQKILDAANKAISLRR